jgi:tetratricopeptide (TPR) repeat protein
MRTAVDLDPDDEHFHAQLGVLLHTAGRLKEAEAEYRAALRLNPALLLSHLNLALVMDATNRPVEAISEFRATVKLDPNYVDALNGLAYDLAENGGNLDEALGFATRADARRPNDGNTIDTLGWIRYRRKEFALAVPLHKRAIELLGDKSPIIADVWTHLGADYEALGDCGLARDAYKSALRLNPGFKAAAEGLKRLGG